MSCICFAGGGSGGHLNAAVAVAQQLMSSAVPPQMLFLTSQRPVDGQVLQQLNCSRPPAVASRPSEIAPGVIWNALPLQTGFGSGLNVFRIPGLLNSLRTSIRLLKEHRVQLVIGLGGFASVPGVLGARMLGVPILLLEQNVIPGRANRFLSRFASLTCVGWPLQAEFVSRMHCPIRVTGVPLRRQFLPTGAPGSGDLKTPAERSPDPDLQRPRLLIVGGSQGAHRLNALVNRALQQAPQVFTCFEICHQTGKTDREVLTESYRQAGVDVSVTEFVLDMAGQLRGSDLIVTRAGATTLAEIHAIRRAAVVVPLSTSADDHQRHNARHFAQVADAVWLDEATDGGAGELISALQGFLRHRRVKEDVNQTSESEHLRGTIRVMEEMRKLLDAGRL